MTYYEDLRRRISRLTGLTGIEVEHILRGLEKAGVDPEAIDWETLGHEIADKANPYEAAWDWLARNYGISKPVELGLDRKIEEYRELQKEYEREYEEMEKYLTEEGIREALRKLYSPETPEEEKEEIREAIFYRSKDYEWIPLGLVSKIAIRDGKEQEYARRFLSEYIKPRKEEIEIEKKLLELMEKKQKLEKEKKAVIYNELRKEFPYFSIDSIEFIGDKIIVRISVLPEYYDLFTKHSFYVEGYSLDDIKEKIHKYEKAYEKTEVVSLPSKVSYEEIVELLKKKEELLREEEEIKRKEVESKIKDLESTHIVFDISVKNNTVTVTAYPRPGHENAFLGVKGKLFQVKGSMDNIDELRNQIIEKMAELSRHVFGLKVSTGKPTVPTVVSEEKVEVAPTISATAKYYECFTCGYMCSPERAAELNYICPKCGDKLYPRE